MAFELAMPPAAEDDPRAFEMIRVWAAKQKLHCVLRIGFWEDRGLDECHSWGILLADMIHHIANAHEEQYGRDPRETITRIREAFALEMEHLSSRLGEFVINPEQRPET